MNVRPAPAGLSVPHNKADLGQAIALLSLYSMRNPVSYKSMMSAYATVNSACGFRMAKLPNLR